MGARRIYYRERGQTIAGCWGSLLIEWTWVIWDSERLEARMWELASWGWFSGVDVSIRFKAKD
jgi:hypothetical protein